MEWDWVIAVTLILGLILAIWARISQQTIVELLRDIREFLGEKREDVQDRAIDIYE